MSLEKSGYRPAMVKQLEDADDGVDHSSDPRVLPAGKERSLAWLGFIYGTATAESLEIGRLWELAKAVESALPEGSDAGLVEAVSALITAATAAANGYATSTDGGLGRMNLTGDGYAEVFDWITARVSYDIKPMHSKRPPKSERGFGE